MRDPRDKGVPEDDDASDADTRIEVLMADDASEEVLADVLEEAIEEIEETRDAEAGG